MPNDLKNQIVIIPKPNYISWEDITKLLHIGYAERVEEGLKYSATAQSVKKTIERVGNGTCLVALLNNKLIATESYKLVEAKNLKGRKWFHDERFYYLHSLTVHPDYKRKGIGLKIRNIIRDQAIQNNIPSLISDTSAEAKWLINWYSRIEHKKVGYISHRGTNYYSVVMRTPIHGKHFAEWYRKLRFIGSYIFCKITTKKNGDYRFLGEMGVKFYRMIKKHDSNETT